MAYRDELQAALLRADEAERKLRAVESAQTGAAAQGAGSSVRHEVVTFGVIFVGIALVGLGVGFAVSCLRDMEREVAACTAKKYDLVDYRADAHVLALYPGSTVVGKHCALSELFRYEGHEYVPCTVAVRPYGLADVERVDLWCSSSCDEGHSCRAAAAVVNPSK